MSTPASPNVRLRPAVGRPLPPGRPLPSLPPPMYPTSPALLGSSLDLSTAFRGKGIGHKQMSASAPTLPTLRSSGAGTPPPYLVPSRTSNSPSNLRTSNGNNSSSPEPLTSSRLYHLGSPLPQQVGVSPPVPPALPPPLSANEEVALRQEFFGHPDRSRRRLSGLMGKLQTKDVRPSPALVVILIRIAHHNVPPPPPLVMTGRASEDKPLL
jgi:hypothetical protein